MRDRRNDEAGRPRLAREGTTLTLRLEGAWRLENGLPAVAPVRAALGEGGVERLRFDAQRLDAWDAGLVAYCLAVVRAAEGLKVEASTDDLPDGARRLLALALANAPRGEDRSRARGRGLLTAVGDGAKGAWAEFVGTVVFVGELTRSCGRLLIGRARFRRSDFVDTLRDVGADTLPVVALISFLVGAILAFVGAIQLRAFGAQLFVADLVGVAMARDMGAIMTAIIVAGRTGASFAASIGTMQGNEEIDALRTMAVEPMDYLVLPRVLALVLMMPFLVVYANLLGILGGAAVGANLPDVTLLQYWHRTLTTVSLTDFAGGIFKGTVYAALVAIAGCMRGMQCGRSAAAVGTATTSAVVTGIVYVIAAAALLTMVFHVLDI